MTHVDIRPVARHHGGEPGNVTACVLCRDAMTPKRARTVSSFLCGACEGMLITTSQELVRWPTGFDEVLGVSHDAAPWPQ